MVAVEDTALAVTDTRGAGRPVVYLNGSYASQSSWRPVIAELGTEWRHITYDERARGKSKRSSDYSFDACIRDAGAVLKATKVDRPLLVDFNLLSCEFRQALSAAVVRSVKGHRSPVRRSAAGNGVAAAAKVASASSSD